MSAPKFISIDDNIFSKLIKEQFDYEFDANLFNEFANSTNKIPLIYEKMLSLIDINLIGADIYIINHNMTYF